MTREMETLSQAHSSLAQDKVQSCVVVTMSISHIFVCPHNYVNIGGARAEYLYIRKPVKAGSAQVSHTGS